MQAREAGQFIDQLQNDRNGGGCKVLFLELSDNTTIAIAINSDQFAGIAIVT